MGRKRGGESQNSGGGKKPRYHQKDAGGKGPALPHGKQGILISVCTGDFMRGGKEAVNVLSDILDELEPKATPSAQSPTAGAGAAATAAAEPAAEADTAQGSKGVHDAAGDEAGSEAAAADFSSLLAEEVTDLKDKSKHRFRFHDTGIKTLLFLEMPFATTTVGPCQVVQRLLEKAEQDRLLQFRHCARFLPCTHICRAEKDAIAATAKELVAERLDCSEAATAESVAVLYEHRAASASLQRMEVIDSVIESVPRPPHTVKLKGASKTISVQVVRNACGLAILPDYHRLGKYNIKTVCEGDQEASKEDKVAGDAGTSGTKDAGTDADKAAEPAAAAP